MTQTKLEISVSRHRRLGQVLIRLETLGGNSLGVSASLRLESLLLRVHHKVVEPNVLKGIMGTDPQLWSKLQHSLQQIDTVGVNRREDVSKILSGVHMECGLVLGELGDAWPGTLCRCSHDAENADDLVFVCGSGEQRSTGKHLGHDAARGPDVDTGVVCSAAEKDIGGAVP